MARITRVKDTDHATQSQLNGLWAEIHGDRERASLLATARRHVITAFAAGVFAGLLLATFTLGIWLRVAVLVLR
jgi:hypothetical protein